MAAKHVIEKIRELVDAVEADPPHRGVLSTSEQIARHRAAAHGLVAGGWVRGSRYRMRSATPV